MEQLELFRRFQLTLFCRENWGIWVRGIAFLIGFCLNLWSVVAHAAADDELTLNTTLSRAQIFTRYSKPSIIYAVKGASSSSQDKRDLLVLPNQAPEVGMMLASRGDLTIAYSQTLKPLEHDESVKGSTVIRGIDLHSYRDPLIYDLLVKQVRGMYLDFRNHRDFRIGGDALFTQRKPIAVEPHATLTSIHFAGFYNFDEEKLLISRVMRPNEHPAQSGFGFVLGAGVDSLHLAGLSEADYLWQKEHSIQSSACGQAGNFRTLTLAALPGVVVSYRLSDAISLGVMAMGGIGWDRYKAEGCDYITKTAYITDFRGNLIWKIDRRFLSLSGYRNNNSRLVDTHWTTVTQSAVEVAVGMFL